MITDVPTEELVIGTFLSYPNRLAEAREYISPDSFTDPKMRELYMLITETADNGDPVNIITVTSALGKHSTHLTPDDVITASNHVCVGELMPFVMRLHEVEARRKLWFVGQELVRASGNELESLDDILNSAKDAISGIYQQGTSGIRDLKDVVTDLRKVIDGNRKGEKLEGTPTGFRTLDEDGGLHGTDLVVIAGATSQGKTSFALTVMLNASCQGARVAFYSLEMTSRQLAARMVAIKSKVRSSDIMYSRLADGDLKRVERGIGELPLDNVFFDDNSTSSIDSIISSIRVMKIKHDIDGAVIDYLQILTVNAGREINKEQLLGEVARRLKNLAKELGIWIIALSQLRRDPDNPVPDINKLRGSGQIAEAADMVMLVYRPEVYGKKYPDPYGNRETHNTAMIDIAKSRNIGTKKFLCTFIPEITLFTDEDAAVSAWKPDEDTPF